MKRIFVLSSHPLFGRGVESLLRQESGFDIVGWETDLDQAIECIKELRPDVVIVDSGHTAHDLAPGVIRILRTGLGTKIIGLNLEDNTLCIYCGEQRMIKEVRDLVRAIESGPLSPEPVRSEGQAKKTKGGG